MRGPIWVRPGVETGARSAVAAGAGITVDISRGPVPVPVPRLVGLDAGEALSALSAAGLSALPVERFNDPSVPAGLVASQDPPPNARVAPGSDVSFSVSGGPRAVIAIDPPLIPAGDPATVSVEIRDIDGTPLHPQPEVTLSLQAAPGSLFGTTPTLFENTIATGADTQGTFTVLASFDAGEPETIAAGGAVLPAISDGPGGTVYTDFTELLESAERRVEDLIEAINLGDGPAIKALDQALADLESEIDTRRLRSLTPFAPAGGMLPTPVQATAGGLTGSVDDNAYFAVGLDLLVLLEQLENLVREGTVPDVILNSLNQDLAAAASARSALSPSDIGVLRAAPQITAILGTYAPRMLVADIRAVRQALRDDGIIGTDGAARSGRFTLPGILSAVRIRQRIINTIYVPYLGEAARMLGAVIAADVLQTYFNAGAISGIITGASQALHVFQVAPSAIEGIGFDPTLSPNNAVTIVGPSLFSAASDAASTLSSATDARGVNSAMDAIQGVIDSADALSDAWKDANSIPEDVRHGCILDGSPSCSQLIFPNGFASVYESEDVLSLPGPVLIIARNLESSNWAVFVANFVPTEPEEEG